MHVIIYGEVAGRGRLGLVSVRRVRLNVNLIAGGQKGQNPEPPIAPKSRLLIVRQKRIDSISIGNVGPLPFRWSKVPTEHQKEIGIPTQRIVCCLSLATPRSIETIVDQVVADDDSAPITVGLEQPIRPG